MILFWRGYKTYKDEDVALSKVCEQYIGIHIGDIYGDFVLNYETYKDKNVALSKVCEQHKRKDDGKANGDPNLWAKITSLSLTRRSLWKSVIFELE